MAVDLFSLLDETEATPRVSCANDWINLGVCFEKTKGVSELLESFGMDVGDIAGAVKLRKDSRLIAVAKAALANHIARCIGEGSEKVIIAEGWVASVDDVVWYKDEAYKLTGLEEGMAALDDLSDSDDYVYADVNSCWRWPRCRDNENEVMRAGVKYSVNNGTYPNPVVAYVRQGDIPGTFVGVDDSGNERTFSCKNALEARWSTLSSSASR